MKKKYNEYQLVMENLKSILKKQKITYRDLAVQLKLSESGVKKIFTAQDGSLQRLVEIAQIAGVSLVDLLEGTAEPMRTISYSENQQELFLSEPLLFKFYWLLVYERDSLEEAERKLKLSRKESFPLLRKMDLFKLLQLLPEGRVRVPPVRQVRWLAQGPLVKKLYRNWSEKLVHQTVDSVDDSNTQFILRYFKVTTSTYRDLIKAHQELEMEFVRRATQDMRGNSDDLMHLQWLTVVNQKSFLF